LYRFLHELLLELRTRFDYVFVDCPSGIGIALETLADPRFETLIVTTPDRTSVSDGERTADFLYSRSAGRVRLIVNRVRPALIKKSLAPDIDAIIDTTAIQLIGLIPEDVRVICAGNTDRLSIDVPRSRSRNAFRNIARRLQGESVDLDRFS
jgi:septum site-determining protein MinD